MGKATRKFRLCLVCGERFRRRTGKKYCSAACWIASTDRPGRFVDSLGYTQVRVPAGTPGIRSDRTWMREHRYVMQQHLGRALDAHETVHHIDGDRQNNAIENLQLRTGRHGKGVHGVCHDCGSHNVGWSKL